MHYVDRFSINILLSNLTNIRPVGAELFIRVDGHTYRQDEDEGLFRDCAKSA